MGGRGPQGGPQGGPGPLGLLRIPEVQAELGLTADQRQKLGTLRDHRGPAGAPPDSRGPGRPDTDPLADILTPAQLTRFHQIELQAQSPMAMLRQDIAMRLQVSEAQRERLQALLPPPPASPGGPDRPGGPPPDGFGRPGRGPGRPGPRLSNAERARLTAQALAILTPAQRAKWNDLTGTPFVLPEPPREVRPPQG